MTGQIYHWQLRWHYEGEKAATTIAICAWLKAVAKDWGFQVEQSENGYKHYQAHMSLIKKHRESEVKALWQEMWPDLQLPNHLSPTTNNALKKNIAGYYATKLDTRIEGPWTSENQTIASTKRTLYDYEEVTELNKVQKYMLEWAGADDHWREILVVGPGACIGKSTAFAHIQATYERVHVVPSNLTAKEILGFLFPVINEGKENRAILLFDLPYATDTKELKEICKTIETISGGCLADCRYTGGKYKKIYAPKIIVITNIDPERMLFAQDRISVIDTNDEAWGVNVPYRPLKIRRVTPPE